MERSLVITFARACQVVSWAPLHGGFRTGVSNVLVQRVVPTDRAELMDRALRQAAEKLALRAAVVGMATAIDLHSLHVVNTSGRNLFVSVLALLPHCKALIVENNNSIGVLSLSISTNLLMFGS